MKTTKQPKPQLVLTKEHRKAHNKELRKTVTPWVIIYTLVLAVTFSIMGWFMRSDFDNTIKSQVTAEVKQLTSKE